MSKKMSDITIRISAVIIAIILWSFVMDDVNPNIERVYRGIPVTYTNVSALDRQGLVVMGPQDVSIDVRVAGSRSDLENFLSSNISAQVDLSGYSEGQVRVGVSVGVTGYTSAVQVIDHEPREVLFTLDRVVRREFPVNVVTSGELDDNFLLGDIDSSDFTVSVRGPSTWVNEVRRVIAHVDLEGRTRSSTTNVAVSVVDDDGNEVRGIEKEPSVISLQIPIQRTQVVPVELQTVGELPENFSINNLQINPEQVTIVGDNRVLGISRILTEEIDVNTFLESSSQEVGLILPSGIELLNGDDTIDITYDIGEEISENYSFDLSEIISNLPEDLTIGQEDLDQTIDLNLTGDRSILEAIDREDIDISVDLTDLEAGTHIIEIRIEEIDGVFIEADPTSVTINLLSPEPLVEELPEQ